MANPSARARTRTAIVLAFLVLFFAVALFSPLHKHTLGKTTTCSFNNLEHQIVSLAEAAVVIDPLVYLLEAPVPPPAPATADGQPVDSRGRAPPAHS